AGRRIGRDVNYVRQLFYWGFINPVSEKCVDVMNGVQSFRDRLNSFDGQDPKDALCNASHNVLNLCLFGHVRVYLPTKGKYLLYVGKATFALFLSSTI